MKIIINLFEMSIKKSPIAISCLVTFYITLASIRSDVFNDCIKLITVPWFSISSYSELSNVKSFSYLINQQNKKIKQGQVAQVNTINNIDKPKDIIPPYLFVLDQSKSSDHSIYKPDWYNQTIINLIDTGYINSSSSLIKEKNNTVSSQDIAKTRLFKMLSDLVEFKRMNNKTSYSFAIWTVGDMGKMIYPIDRSEKHSPVNQKNVKNAMQVIQNSTIELHENTDFEHLIEEILKDYEGKIKKNKQKQPNSPSIIITFISDLLHDVEGKMDNFSKKKKNIKILEKWNKLRKSIQRFPDQLIQANMIILGHNSIHGKEKIFQICPTFERAYKRKHQGWRLSKHTIDKDIWNSVLFPNEIIDNNIFLYSNSNTNNIAINDVQILFKEKSKITIGIPSELNSENQNVSFRCQIIGNKKTSRDSGLVTANDNITFDIEENQILNLSLDNYIPRSKKIHIWLSHDINHRNYNFTIHFKQILPYWIAILMLILQCLIIILVIVNYFVPIFIPRFREYKTILSKKNTIDDENKKNIVEQVKTNNMLLSEHKNIISLLNEVKRETGSSHTSTFISVKDTINNFEQKVIELSNLIKNHEPQVIWKKSDSFIIDYNECLDKYLNNKLKEKQLRKFKINWEPVDIKRNIDANKSLTLILNKKEDQSDFCFWSVTIDLIQVLVPTYKHIKKIDSLPTSKVYEIVKIYYEGIFLCNKGKNYTLTKPAIYNADKKEIIEKGVIEIPRYK